MLAFFADRLKVQLREQGARHDLVDSVFALEGQDDVVLIVRRVEALGKFLDTDDGKNLLAGFKRAANILRIEEKRDNRSYDGAVSGALLKQTEEQALANAVAQATTLVRGALESATRSGDVSSNSTEDNTQLKPTRRKTGCANGG